MLYPKPNTQYPILSIIIKEPDSAKSLTEYCPIMDPIKMQISPFQAAEEDMIKQKQKLQHEVQDLHSHIQVGNTKG